MVNGNTGATAILLQLDQTSTISGGAITIQGTYDGTNWITLPAWQVVDPTSSTLAQAVNPYTLVVSTNKPFMIFPAGFQQVRINLTTVIVGSGTVTPYVTLLPYQVADPIFQAITSTNTGSPVPAGNFWIGSTDIVATPSATFTRPANTTAYSSGQLVGNSTTAGSVTPLSFTAARVTGGNFYVRRFTMSFSSHQAMTGTSFRLHLYTVTPAAITNGDGGTYAVTTANEFCEMDTSSTIPTPGTDVSILYGVPSPGDGNECNGVATGGSIIYGLMEARGAYTPGSSETVTAKLEVHQN
jgi:hypothetical protein